MGIIVFFLKLVLKVAKPFLKQAILESIMEVIAEYTGEELGGEMTTYEFETMPLPDIETTVFEPLR